MNSVGCETPLIRKRRNPISSISDLSAKRTSTIAELKSLVCNLETKVTEISNSFKCNPMSTQLENELSIMKDKIEHLANTSKTNYQYLTERINDSGNEKHINYLKQQKKQLKSHAKQLNDVQTKKETVHAQDQQHGDETDHPVLVNIPKGNSKQFFRS